MLSKKAKQSKTSQSGKQLPQTHTRFHYKNLKKWSEFAKRLALKLNSKYKNFVKYVIDANSKRFQTTMCTVAGCFPHLNKSKACFCANVKTSAFRLLWSASMYECICIILWGHIIQQWYMQYVTSVTQKRLSSIVVIHYCAW